MDQLWANRAASAEAAVTARPLRRQWGLPGTQLGVVAWPAATRLRGLGTWHYWWQAHLIDAAVCFLGFLFPLWDARRQTLADKLVGTVCVPNGRR